MMAEGPAQAHELFAPLLEKCGVTDQSRVAEVKLETSREYGLLLRVSLFLPLGAIKEACEIVAKPALQLASFGSLTGECSLLPGATITEMLQPGQAVSVTGDDGTKRLIWRGRHSGDLNDERNWERAP